jgi:hypothetical protein
VFVLNGGIDDTFVANVSEFCILCGYLTMRCASNIESVAMPTTTRIIAALGALQLLFERPHCGQVRRTRLQDSLVNANRMHLISRASLSQLYGLARRMITARGGPQRLLNHLPRGQVRSLF